MSESDFREDLKQLLKKHTLGADELRDVADDMHSLADKWENMEDTL